MQPDYYSPKDLVHRLTNAANHEHRPIIFLVGSAICLPDHQGGRGVPGVSQIIDIIREEFEDPTDADEFDSALTTGPSNRYQNAFRFLHARKGQTIANSVVRAAVWKALDSSNWPDSVPHTSPRQAGNQICAALEANVGVWHLPNPVNCLGRLLVECSDVFGKAILTTNFDPLIAVSIDKHGGRRYRTVLHSDGPLGQTSADGTHIVHLHGFWYGADTLHTPQQLTTPRPYLTKSLTHLLEGAILVVVGYGGWDDVITTTLAEILADSASNTEIHWAFHERSQAGIISDNLRVLDLLKLGIGRGRVSLYDAVDCSTLFQSIHESLEPSYRARERLVSDTKAIIVEDQRAPTATRRMRVQFEVPLPSAELASPGRPLVAQRWVGREHELRLLSTTTAPVAFITGIGGQGKSVLAGEYLKQQTTTGQGRVEFWDWRDCREESDRLRTQLLRLIERLTDGALDASRIEATDTKAVVQILFQCLGERRALLVFDNVDQYIDLRRLQPVKDLEILVAEAQSRSHGSLFLFTCRPNVHIDESRALAISLEGLDQSDVGELVNAQGIHASDALVAELHKVTGGHPLWINLLLMQAGRKQNDLRRELDAVATHGAELPDTTRKIWKDLHTQQRVVLRTMAELDRPESESNLAQLIPAINFNRLNKALKTLRAYHLIEYRTQPDGPPLVDLHPLIREFVRKEFPKPDREHYVGPILDFLDHEISRYSELLPEAPTFEVMDYWIRKAEFHIAFERFSEATTTLAQVGPSLIRRGYSEVLIRVSIRLFARVNWADACSSFKDFDGVFERAIKAMVETGHGDVSKWLKEFQGAISGTSAQFILLCDLHCYADWFRGNCASAIAWGERAERLKASTGVDTKHSSEHNLALARRDAGYLKEALEGFLDGESLEEVLGESDLDGKGAHFFGNVGRC